MRIDGHRHVGLAGSRGPCTAEEVLDQMDAFGFDRTVILPINVPHEQPNDAEARQAAYDQANRDFIASGAVGDLLRRMRAAREDNRTVAQAVARHPERLLGVFQINPWRGATMLDEAETAIRARGFCGLKLHPMVNGYPADHEVVDPVLKLAERLGVFVAFHTSYGCGTEPWRIGRVAARFPAVDVVLYHAGVIGLDGRTQVDDAIRVAAENPNVWLDLADSQPPAVQAIVDRGPAERILFGSDAPFGNFEQQLARVRDAIGSRTDLERMILGENVVRLLQHRPGR